MKMPHKISLTYKKLFLLLSSISGFVKYELIYSRVALYVFQLLITIHQRANSDNTTQRKISVAKYSSSHGFTLVQLIITIAVLAIIATIAAPAIQTQLAQMESRRIKSQLEDSLTLAKAESFIRRQNVLLCLSNTGGRCHRDSDKTLLLFVDKNDNKHFDAQVDHLLNQQSLNLKYSKVRLRVGGKRHYTKFWGDSGLPRGHFGHLKYCPTEAYNKAMYLISFNQGGIVKQKLNENHPTQCDK